MSATLRALVPGDLAAARGLLAAACRHDDAAAVAEEKLFGAAPDADVAGVVAESGGQLVGVVASSARWVRLLAVAPPARGRGIGTALLAAAEAAIAARGQARARTLDQPGNYLAPGVAEGNPAIAWLERRGYRRLRENCNLEVDVARNPRVTPARAAELAAAARALGYEVRRATAADRVHLPTIAREFAPAIAFEVDRALAPDPADVHLALAADGGLAGFAAHDGNNRGLGWFGPAGTLPAHRKRGVGEALLLACLGDVAATGRAISTIAWIGPREFYARTVGIAGERRFAVLEKELSP